MLHMYLLTKPERELYQHVRLTLFQGILPFVLIEFVLYLGAAFFFKNYFTLSAFIIFTAILALYSIILVAHTNYALKHDYWLNLESSQRLIIFTLLYLSGGFAFWNALKVYLLHAGCTDLSMIAIFSGGCAAFAIGLLGIFQRIFLAVILSSVFLFSLFIYVQVKGDASPYIIQVLCVGLFDSLLLHVQNQRLLGVMQVKSKNLELVSALEQKNLELGKANLAQSRYLSAASHDLRQPLHALALITDDVQRKNHNPTIELPLKRMEQAIESLSKSFDAMLNLSRLDAGVIQPHIQSFAIQRLYDRLLLEFEATAHQKGLSFTVVSSNVWVLADEGLLYSILSNFVSNAIRYTEHGGVLIGTRRDGAHVIPSVYDTGVGIPPDQIEQIFGEYQRLDYAQQRVAGGVGLGLAISERMAMLLGARFIVRSNVNQGSAFGIRLPRTVATKKTELDAHTIHSNYLTGKKAVLLDDHDIALEKLDELLSSWGMDVSVISSINMLQKIADEQGHIDLVISDYHLGLARENGLDILKYAQEMQPSPPPHCVLITGDTTIDLIELTQDLGVHLQHKPMSPTRLRAFLNTLLQNAATETIDKAA